MRALDVTAAEAAHHGATVGCVSVASNAPGPHGRSPEELPTQRKALDEEQSKPHEIEDAAHAIISLDSTIVVDDRLLGAVEEMGADLDIIASHRPDDADHVGPRTAARPRRPPTPPSP